MKLAGLRFFTVFGEWGRPDMLLIKFFNYALGKSNGKEILYFNKDETSFFNKSNISEEIDIREFNQAISDLDIKKIDLLSL
jgi:nucleoside-diphosphate-sugar epimerase